MSSQWTLTVGLRYTDDDKDLRTPTETLGASDSQLSGNLTLAFSPDDVSTYWVMAARSFRAPTIQGRDVAFGTAYADTEIRDRNLLVATCGSGTCTPLNRTQVVSGINVANVDGNAFPNAPRTTYSTTGRFSYPLGKNSEVFAFADYTRQGKTQIFLYRAAEFRTNNQWELGLRTGWRKLDGSLEIALFGRNVTQQDNIVGAVDFNNLTGFVADPRIWGLSLSTAF